ncbi:MAG: cysteine--tRNA ligase [Patescibacteria group bacterium]
MKLYNTLTRKLEEFEAIEQNKIRFYHCGPTVYWVQHIGNLRAMIWADFIRRSLIYLGYEVTFVRNYTDVGHLTSDADEGQDKMEKGVKREGLLPKEIADKYIGIFEDDCKKLNILDPNHTPRATDYIRQIIAMIQTLIEKKHAYITESAIYFDISTFKNYNALNKQNIELLYKGSGKGTVEDPKKKHFADFALWFFKTGAHKNALQTWDSPWGVGFPGWHIECSVMAKELLGKTIDIHMGGIEHISVHHTNEIAQSESANGVPFVHYWLHNEHLDINNEKMAKSKGSGFTLKEIVEAGFDPLDLRYFFMQAHYRSKQNFTWDALEAAQNARKKLNSIVSQMKQPRILNIASTQAQAYIKQFKETAISHDFQIPQALALIWDLIRPSVKIPDDEKYLLLIDFDRILGLKLDQIKKDTIPAMIISLAEKRAKSKKEGDFKTADVLRKDIEEKGYLIEDKKEGYQIRKK